MLSQQTISTRKRGWECKIWQHFYENNLEHLTGFEVFFLLFLLLLLLDIEMKENGKFYAMHVWELRNDIKYFNGFTRQTICSTFLFCKHEELFPAASHILGVKFIYLSSFPSCMFMTVNCKFHENKKKIFWTWQEDFVGWNSLVNFNSIPCSPLNLLFSAVWFSIEAFHININSHYIEDLCQYTHKNFER